MVQHPFRQFNIADWFSFYRIAAAPLLVALILLDERLWFSWLLGISFVTDFIDGQLARRLGIVSPRGSQLDSIGDQLTLLVALAGLVRFEFDFIRAQIILILIPLGLYFLQMLAAWWRYGRVSSFHTYTAKVSAFVQGVFVLWLLFFGPVYWLFYTMIALSVLETVEELILIYLFREWQSDVKGVLFLARSESK